MWYKALRMELRYIVGGIDMSQKIFFLYSFGKEIK